MKSMIKAIT